LLAAAPLVAAVALACSAAQAQEQMRSGPIYSCEVNGKKLTSDRPIPECIAREQRVLNKDGSVREVRPPVPTADERAAIEAKQQEEALARSQQREAVRRDRNLLQRFPNQAAHDKAREAALDAVRGSLKTSEARLIALEKERKPLLDETEFYVGKPLPLKLKQAIDANDAATGAQRDLVANQKAEIVRVSKLFDDELERLRRLWAGAQPGSMGIIASSEPAASAPTKPRTARQ
jgi:hypothetical protein